MAGISTSGWGKLADLLEEGADALEKSSDRWVGTDVWYAHFPEFGTSRQAATPYFRRGLRQAAQEFGVGFSVSGERKLGFEAVVLAPDENVVGPLAEEAVKRIKGWIRRQGLVERGALLNSVTEARTVQRLSQKSKRLASQKSGRAD